MIELGKYHRRWPTSRTSSREVSLNNAQDAGTSLVEWATTTLGGGIPALWYCDRLLHCPLLADVQPSETPLEHVPIIHVLLSMRHPVFPALDCLTTQYPSLPVRHLLLWSPLNITGPTWLPFSGLELRATTWLLEDSRCPFSYRLSLYFANHRCSGCMWSNPNGTTWLATRPSSLQPDFTVNCSSLRNLDRHSFNTDCLCGVRDALTVVEFKLKPRYVTTLVTVRLFFCCSA